MDLKVYKKMLRARPIIDEVKWQKTALFLEDIWKKTKVVLAAGTSSGKTFFTIMYLNMFYSIKGNRSKRTLIIPASQTNLRSNFQEALEDFGPDFEYVVATSCEELRAAAKTDIPVIVCLPQTLARCIDAIPQVEKLIIDEAHTWYFQNTIKNIIKQSKPVQQFLLTGTPDPFILRGGFFIHFVPVMELFDVGRIANTEVHVISSDYEFKNEDYNERHNLSRTSMERLKNNSRESLRKVVLGMIKKLRNPIKGLKNINRLTNQAAGLLFKHLDKTIIWAGSIAQAEEFTKELRSYKGLENAVLLSHSKNDEDSEMMDKFKQDDSIRVLVSVNRGRMGWSYTELFNAVDFTMSRNLSVILQMLARLFRISKVRPNDMKYYYKVANAKDAGYMTVVMKGVLLLLDREWYTKFNGKNFFDMKIPVTVPRRKREVNPDGPTRRNKKQNTYDYTKLDIPLDMNFFKTVYSKQDDAFSTVAWTTIKDVRDKIWNIRTTEVIFNEVMDFIKKNKPMSVNQLKPVLHGIHSWIERYPHYGQQVLDALEKESGITAEEVKKICGQFGTMNKLFQEAKRQRKTDPDNKLAMAIRWIAKNNATDEYRGYFKNPPIVEIFEATTGGKTYVGTASDLGRMFDFSTSYMIKLMIKDPNRVCRKLPDLKIRKVRDELLKYTLKDK